MALQKIQLRPGVVKDQTAYTNEGGWRSSNLVRFRLGYPESIGGWQKLTSRSIYGTCRSLLPWVALDNSQLLGVGTSSKYYIEYGGTYYDITPIRRTVTRSGPFAATNGSATIVVTDTSHGANPGDFVTFSGANSLGGNITAGILNQEYRITEVVNANSYKITASVAASSGDSGTGGSVTMNYQINVGTNSGVTGTGWSIGVWGRDGWGTGTTVNVTNTLRAWSQDNYGEDLLYCVREGGIYYWDKTAGLTTRGVTLSSLSTDSQCPTVAKQVMVSDRDRHVIVLGADYGDGAPDPMAIRFSDQEDPFTWTPTATNTAGDLRLGSGSSIIRAVETKRSILVFTDTSLYSMQFLGPPYTFGVEQIASNITIMGFNSAVAMEDTVFWMGRDCFYMHNGQTQQIECPVKDYVFRNLNSSQYDKVFASLNSGFNEVTWFYPSKDSSENDLYVTFNFAESVWTYGTLARTAWVDRGVRNYPIAAAPETDGSSYLYNHEIGRNDGSTSPETPLNAYIESSPVDISEGDQFVFMRRIIPDLTILGDTASSPTVTMTLKMQNFPGENYSQESDSNITRTAQLPIEQYTVQAFTRLRGRAFTLRIESNQLDMGWRLGSPRLDLIADGRR